MLHHIISYHTYALRDITGRAALVRVLGAAADQLLDLAHRPPLREPHVHYVTLHYIKLLPYLTLHYIDLLFASLMYVTLHFIITLHHSIKGDLTLPCIT